MLELNRMAALVECKMFSDLLVRVQNNADNETDLGGVAHLEASRVFSEVGVRAQWERGCVPLSVAGWLSA